MPKRTARPWLTYIDSPDGADTGGGAESASQQQRTTADKTSDDGPLFTQSALDKVVADRLARERAKFAGFDDLKSKAAEFDRLQAEQQTEHERAQAALAKAQKDAEDARTQALQYRAAAAAGIDPEGDDFGLIGSGDEQAVMARAARLGVLLRAERDLAAVNAAPETPAPTGRPKPVLRPGAAPIEETQRPSSVDAAREAALRRGLTAAAQQ